MVNFLGDVLTMENFKIECLVSTGISYLAHPFEIYFDTLQSVHSFITTLPISYTIKLYEKDSNGKWNIISDYETA